MPCRNRKVRVHECTRYNLLSTDILDLNNLNRKSYNVGTFSDGPFNPNVDPIGALITFVGCSPGND